MRRMIARVEQQRGGGMSLQPMKPRSTCSSSCGERLHNSTAEVTTRLVATVTGANTFHVPLALMTTRVMASSDRCVMNEHNHQEEQKQTDKKHHRNCSKTQDSTANAAFSKYKLERSPSRLSPPGLQGSLSSPARGCHRGSSGPWPSSREVPDPLRRTPPVLRHNSRMPFRLCRILPRRSSRPRLEATSRGPAPWRGTEPLCWELCLCIWSACWYAHLASTLLLCH